MRKEPKEVALERKEEARAANAAARREQQEQNEGKKKMKGKNKPTRRQCKKQLNIIEERKGERQCETVSIGLCDSCISWSIVS